ncbi:hypothetical protein OG401_39100 [Kitasatospora purpeofusca]|uniref:hypothetical protein n=1 Tax=Kitasatospora purpeofusca TaxID=67352 RepID=UPI002254C7F9|nr:hypothetical protein [Kitasatospora purpeofusca]MCX4690232.1 hypothetical protein [Kitasatospora purpeofusca]
MTAEPDAGQPRLRPGVAVTPLREGLHLRGRGTSLTLEGSRALPALWEVLSARLADAPANATDPGRTGPAAGSPEPAPGPPDPTAGHPKLEAALATVTARLREHGLLVDRFDDAEPPPWPGSVAERPGDAVAAIAAAHPVVVAADPEDGTALAVARALARSGAAPTVRADASLPVGQVLVVAGEPPVAVGLRCDEDGGFVTAPAGPARARADLAALTERLRPDSGRGHGSSAPRALPLLLAAATAQRLLCAVAGLPDPGDPADNPRLLPGRPAVLIADTRPLRAEHHPWAAGPGPVAAPPEDLDAALRRVAALGDPRLGVFDAPSPGDLPQLPTALVSCRTPDGLLVAGAARTDLARLTGAVRALELRLAAADPGATGATEASGAAPRVTVGAGPVHALGRALRRATLAAPWAAAPVGAAPGLRWHEHPQARHWTTTLARRLGHDPAVTVRRLAGSAVLATVQGSRAVEATAADAVAVAALAALTRLAANDLDPAHGLGPARDSAPARVRVRVHHTAFSGAAAPLAAAGRDLPDWVDEGWTGRWLAGLADREAHLQAALHGLTGLRTTPWQPRGTAAHRLADALAGCGFTVLVPEGDHR